jgi:hypothetical protein
MRAVSPVHGYLCFFRLARTGREDDLINGSGNGDAWLPRVRAVSRFSSAFLADLAMRGFAISFLTLACVARPDFVLLLFCGTYSWWRQARSDAVQFRTVPTISDSYSLLPIYLLLRSAGLVCFTQVWAANSLSRSASYFLFISSSESPAGVPRGLNFQLHSEQPKP